MRLEALGKVSPYLRLMQIWCFAHGWPSGVSRRQWVWEGRKSAQQAAFTVCAALPPVAAISL